MKRSNKVFLAGLLCFSLGYITHDLLGDLNGQLIGPAVAHKRGYTQLKRLGDKTYQGMLDNKALIKINHKRLLFVESQLN